MRFSNLWRSDGTISRGQYAVIGAVGFALKHNLDRLIASLGFHRPWGIFNYWVPVRDVARITEVGGPEAIFLATMVAVSLPFIWVGVVMTIKRLRSARLPPSYVALFFAPFVNLLFFLVLCLLPERESPQTTEPSNQTGASLLGRIVPANGLGSAAVALLFTVPIGFGAALLATQVLANYGWGLFVALPFAMGFVAAGVYGIRQPRSLPNCIGVACLSVLLLGAGLFGLAFEGVACLIMALPLALLLATFGGVCSYLLQKRGWLRNDAPVLFSILLLFAPGVEWIEHVVARPSPLYVVRTAIDVKAPPEKVWAQVIAFSEIPPPTEWMFRAGVAYPMRARMLGTGVGAERHCEFSTGAFVEPIEVWDAPYRLQFSVISNPPPMEEWTPYSHLHPPHLDGFLVSKGGQFLLTPLPHGGTHLEGTTWYRHGLWPSAYWQLWSDTVIHRIHMRVLMHIRDEVEGR